MEGGYRWTESSGDGRQGETRGGGWVEAVSSGDQERIGERGERQRQRIDLNFQIEFVIFKFPFPLSHKTRRHDQGFKIILISNINSWGKPLRVVKFII